jgi:5-methylcytosine-specific restriction endonuclease McrA
MTFLSQKQAMADARALKISSQYKKLEFELIDVLDEVERTSVYKKLNFPSLFKYATDRLGLSEAISYTLISIARKSREVPQLRTSGLKVSKAGRIVSVMNKENAGELIEFARTHTSRQIEAEIARRNPKVGLPDKVRMISGDTAQLTITVSQEFLDMLKRAASIEAQNGSKAKSQGEVLESFLRTYLYYKDPVQKAKRAKPRPTLHVQSSGGRTKLTAAQKHEVFARDEGRCTHVSPGGERCNSDRWVEVHHIRPVSFGGGNEPENLTTLCSFHHDLAHQLSLPLEGQTTRVCAGAV